MSVSQVRTYFQSVMSTVDSTMKEWDTRFDEDNIPRNRVAKAYYIDYGNLSSDVGHGYVEDEITVLVQLFFKAKRDVAGNKDASYDIAHSVKQEAMKHSRANVGANIKMVTPVSIEQRDIDEDDNSLIYDLEFTVRMIFPIN